MMAAILEFRQTRWWQPSWNLSNAMVAAILEFVKQHGCSHLEILQSTSPEPYVGSS